VQKLKQKILFPYRHLLSFVKNDFEILQEKYDVISIHVTKNIFKSLVNFFRYTWKVDLVFAYFAGVHAFLGLLFARLFGKKMIVVSGGYDAAYVPEINYGAFTSWWRGWIAKYVFENADMVIACTNNTKKEILEHAKPKKIKVIYDGVNVKNFYPSGKKNEKLVISVGIINQTDLKRKGMETFVKAAKYLPDVEFVLAGKPADNSINYLKSIATENVKFPGFVSDEELLKLYQNAKVYVQVSAHEAPGLSLAEAMLCGCIPVVTRRGAIPEIVEDTGFYVPYNDPEKTAEAIKEALKADEKLGRKGREIILRLLTMEEIKKDLLETVETVMNEK